MKLLGLTGSIGMGKSATASMFTEAGIPVYDADAAVHALYARGGAAVGPVGEVFEGAIVDGAIDRDKLRALVLPDPDALNRLNSIVHPLVGQSQLSFREEAKTSGAAVAVLDIPLLFETGGDKRVDYVGVVTAPADVQRVRVLAREGMTESAFKAILSKQVPDAEKRARADFVISTAFGFEFTRAHVKAIIAVLSRSDLGQSDEDT